MAWEHSSTAYFYFISFHAVTARPSETRLTLYERYRRKCYEVLEDCVSQATETFREFPCNPIMTSTSGIICDPAGLQNMNQTLRLASFCDRRASGHHDNFWKLSIDSIEAKRPTLVNRDRQHCCADYRTTNNLTHPSVSDLLGIKPSCNIVNNSSDNCNRPYRQQSAESQKIVSNLFTRVERYELNSDATITPLHMK
ncbi:hypothetical protein CSKR_102678 [Clonorchis sinensis]|uniref:Uncharacterized protein n=1 Tax=Clonorchis sinensis TaxID=79923 RepID=A0A419PQ62_CLOSI|nr:hypothetical protein CSKR_102678 [Clonorchis sinensis]